MDLKELFKGTDIKISKNLNINGISINSKQVKKGDLFIALRGEKTDGLKYLDEAIKNGAVAIISEKRIKTTVPSFYTPNILEALSKISTNFYKNPSQKLFITGITGTKGKTTTSFIIDEVLKKLNYKTAVIGTINYRTYKRIIAPAQNTTPLAPDLNRLLSLFLKDNVKHCVMEISSHSLALKRVEDIKFNTAIFTNLQSDHLDFHKNLKNYFKSKLHLFELLIKSPKKNKFAILNADDKKSFQIIKLLKGKIPFTTFSIKDKSDFKAENVKISNTSSEFEIIINKQRYHVHSKLVGEYNIYNLLAAMAYLYALSIPIKKIIKTIAEISFIPGRLEKLTSSMGFTVYIDYAHTTDSLKNVLLTLRKLPHERIITVFGCGGNRDKTKRGPMGKVACKYSDYAIITSDNPRDEKPQKIISEIEKPLKNRYKNYEKIENRKDAIFKAISLAKKGDIILIAGKGHETYQIIGNKKLKFDDKKFAQKAMKLMGKL